MAVVTNPSSQFAPEGNVYPFPAGNIAIATGDLCYRDFTTGLVYPASNLADQGTAGQNQAYFAAQFIGVAAGPASTLYPDGVNQVLIWVDGMIAYELDAAATVVNGAGLAVYATTSGCSNQIVTPVTTNTGSIIGQAVEGVVSGTSVRMKLKTAAPYGIVGNGTPSQITRLYASPTTQSGTLFVPSTSGVFFTANLKLDTACAASETVRVVIAQGSTTFVDRTIVTGDSTNVITLTVVKPFDPNIAITSALTLTNGSTAAGLSITLGVL